MSSSTNNSTVQELLNDIRFGTLQHLSPHAMANVIADRLERTLKNLAKSILWYVVDTLPQAMGATPDMSKPELETLVLRAISGNTYGHAKELNKCLFDALEAIDTDKMERCGADYEPESDMCLRCDHVRLCAARKRLAAATGTWPTHEDDFLSWRDAADEFISLPCAKGCDRDCVRCAIRWLMTNMKKGT